MLRTITIGTCVSVQGLSVAEHADGRTVVKVGDDTFVGMPVPRMPAHRPNRSTCRPKRQRPGACPASPFGGRPRISPACARFPPARRFR